MKSHTKPLPGSVSQLRWALWLVLVALGGALPFRAGADGPPKEKQAAAAIDFSRQIRPILSDNCFRCHGPDEKERKAKLRLDIKEGALKELRGGGFAVVPGHPEKSE